MLLPSFHSSKRQGGQGLAEYALILSLVALAVVAAVAFLGRTLSNQYCFVTYRLSPSADLSSTCSVPMVMPEMVDRGPGYINLEARIHDPDGDPDNPYAAISQVEFYVDGSLVQTEYHYRYCLGSNQNGNPCRNFNIGGLSAGEHTVLVQAYDSDGNVGRARYKFTK